MSAVMKSAALAAAAVLGVATAAQAATMTFQNGADTTTGAQEPSGGYQGTEFSQLDVGSTTGSTSTNDGYGDAVNSSNGGWIPLFRFDVSSLHGVAASVNSATLTLAQNNSYAINSSVSVYAITQANTGWSQRSSGANLNQDTLTPWAGGGWFGSSDYDSAHPLVSFTADSSVGGSYHNISMTLPDTIVMDWINGDNPGFTVFPDTTGTLLELFGPAHGADGSGPATIRPMLVIDYNPVPEPMTGSLLLLGGGLVALRRRRK